MPTTMNKEGSGNREMPKIEQLTMSPEPEPVFRFMDLPAEIRGVAFEQLFSGESETMTGQVLRTSKQLYDEGHHALYQQHRIRLSAQYGSAKNGGSHPGRQLHIESPSGGIVAPIAQFRKVELCIELGEPGDVAGILVQLQESLRGADVLVTFTNVSSPKRLMESIAECLILDCAKLTVSNKVSIKGIPVPHGMPTRTLTTVQPQTELVHEAIELITEYSRLRDGLRSMFHYVPATPPRSDLFLQLVLAAQHSNRGRFNTYRRHLCGQLEELLLHRQGLFDPLFLQHMYLTDTEVLCFGSLRLWADRAEHYISLWKQ